MKNALVMNIIHYDCHKSCFFLKRTDFTSPMTTPLLFSGVMPVSVVYVWPQDIIIVRLTDFSLKAQHLLMQHSTELNKTGDISWLKHMKDVALLQRLEHY